MHAAARAGSLLLALTLCTGAAAADSDVRAPGSATGRHGGMAAPDSGNLPADMRSLRVMQPLPTGQALGTPGRADGGVTLDDLQRAVLDRVNHHRTRAGLPPVAAHAQLLQAAQAHASYLNGENYSGHQETDAGNPFFTGRGPLDRITAARYDYAMAGEVVARQSTFHPDAAVDALMMAVYHRFIILSGDYTHAGPGAALADRRGAETLDVTVDFGAENPPPPTGILAIYPVDGQENVPVDFDPAHESPNPMPGHTLVGYPASVQADSIRVLRVDSFALFEVGTEAALSAVEAKLLTHSLDEETPEFGAALIPVAPLKPATKYRAAFSGAVDQIAVAKTWEFSTTAASAVIMEFAYTTVQRGSSQKVTLRDLDDQRGHFYICYGPTSLVKSLVQETEAQITVATTDACPDATVCEVHLSTSYVSSCTKPFASGRFGVVDRNP